MEVTISALEQAIVTRLSVCDGKRIEAQQGPGVRYIEGYGGQLDTEEALAQALQKAPAIWVTYDGETSHLSGQNLIRQINMSILVLVTSYSQDELRLGGPQVPGLYPLIETVRKDLVNNTCGLDISPLQLSSITPLWRGGPEGGGFSLAVLRFSTEVYSEAEPQPDIICDEPLLVTEWKLVPLGELGKIQNIYKPWEKEST
ncbi:MAG: DUF1834 family protein [Deltaproteobacteria bacterium]|nr:DUF1834 family protein [Deltaproteobacteria bacterium]